MADLKTDLAECVRLHGLATRGKWPLPECPEHSPNEAIIPISSGYIECGGSRSGREANAAAIVALHNLFHDHGDELLAREAQLAWLLDRVEVRGGRVYLATGHVRPRPASESIAAIDAAIAGRAGG